MKPISRINSLFITITFPFILIMFSIRVLFTPLFLVFEYNFPGFPPDPYGFSTEERLKWGSLSIQYLFNNSGPEFLGNLAFDNGTHIYNEREVSHMLDVKVLLKQSLTVFYIILGLYLLVIAWLIRKKEMFIFWNAASQGGWLTVAIIGFIFIAIMLGFDALFTNFHRLFFTGDTWLFNYSDTLIRLFPMRLWQDAFIFMGIITLALALFFAIAGKNISKKSRFLKAKG